MIKPWTQKFLNHLGERVRELSATREDDAVVANAQDALDMLGIPKDIWYELTAELRSRNVEREVAKKTIAKYESIFLCGVAVGWYEARNQDKEIPPAARDL